MQRKTIRLTPEAIDRMRRDLPAWVKHEAFVAKVLSLDSDVRAVIRPAAMKTPTMLTHNRSQKIKDAIDYICEIDITL